MMIALVVIDVQVDFCDGGVLPARNTASLIVPLNRTIQYCESQNMVSVFTRDWHPPNHCSFQAFGGPWPVHCVQGSPGSQFARDLHLPPASLVIDIEKAQDVVNTSYSAFENTDLHDQLRRRGILAIVACGIATDYCVKATVLDALRSNFHVTVLTDLIRPINVNPYDESTALSEMKSKGAVLMSSLEWMNRIQEDAQN